MVDKHKVSFWGMETIPFTFTIVVLALLFGLTEQRTADRHKFEVKRNNFVPNLKRKRFGDSKKKQQQQQQEQQEQQRQARRVNTGFW